MLGNWRGGLSTTSDSTGEDGEVFEVNISEKSSNLYIAFYFDSDQTYTVIRGPENNVSRHFNYDIRFSQIDGPYSLTGDLFPIGSSLYIIDMVVLTTGHYMTRISWPTGWGNPPLIADNWTDGCVSFYGVPNFSG